MRNMNIHIHAANGDMAALAAELENGVSVEAHNKEGRTPLMVAAASPKAGIEMLQFLLDQGANVNARSLPRKPVELTEEGRATMEEAGIDTSIYDRQKDTPSVDSVLRYAVKSASHEKIVLLLEAGADAGFVNAAGYGILVNAMHRIDDSDEEHRAIVETLIDAGTPLDAVSDYGESAICVASRCGKFEMVAMLLERGADPEPLDWTPLFHEVATGNLNAVARLVDEGATLEQRDAWDRTPFLLSVHAGHLEIAKHLLDRGSDRSATGRCGQTALMYAISRDDAVMLKWLIAMGWDVEEADEFGGFPLEQAAQEGAVGCVKVLLGAGARVDRRDEYDSGAIQAAASPKIVHLLAAAGEDLSDVGPKMRQQLAGTEADSLIEVSEQDYHGNRQRVFGASNPEKMNNVLWDVMVRTRMGAHRCASNYNDSSYDRGIRVGRDPVWCFQRFGHSITQLPDGRYVEIGGEHEDHYDPDFCIYNDVVVHHGEGTFDIYGYPEEVFPPTDFHSATLVWPHIYIIGCLGYPKQRRPGETPVYRLHCETWAIERVACTGDAPGWVYQHQAKLMGDRMIRVFGGLLEDGVSEDEVKNTGEFVLNLTTLEWSGNRRDT